MSCQAQLVVVKSTGRPVRFLHPPHGSSMQVVRAAGAHASPGVSHAQSDDATATTTPTEGTPAYLQWAYDLTGLAESGGAGDVVAVVDPFDDPTALGDLATFRYTYGIWPCQTASNAADCKTQIADNGIFQQYNQSGQQIDQTGDSGVAPPTESATEEPGDPKPGSWEVEESLDIEAVSSFCNHCTVDLVESDPGDCTPNLDQECTYPDFDSNLQTAVETAAEMLNANQISMSFSEPNDAGSTPAGPWAFANVASLAASGDSGFLGFDGHKAKYYVSYPAALSDITAVGGTSLSTASGARGFGESVWNDSAGATESGCDTSQAEAAYQVAVSTTDCSGRAYNDVSADGDPETGLDIYDSFGGADGVSGWELAGGTSLATPLTAAFDASTGIDDASSNDTDPGTTTGSVSGTLWPAWPYSVASLLNDVTSGSDGSCGPNLLLICNAAVGWDGPTGEGSISGDVVNGPPGIGASNAAYANATDVTFSGGVYPNGAAATSYWQYWPDAAGLPSAATTLSNSTIGSTVEPVSQTVCGSLRADTLYDYRLVATNSYAGDPVYGYYGSFTTPATEAAPSTSASPTISGSVAVGQTLTAQPGTWNDQTCNSSPTYQWQKASSSAGTFSNITNATSVTYVPTSLDAGQWVRVAVSETNNGEGGTASVYSSADGIPAVSTTTTTSTTTSTTTTTTNTGLPAMMLVAPTVAGTLNVGRTLAVSPGTYTNATAIAVHFYRCAHTCVELRSTGAYRYRFQRADEGKYIKVVVTAAGAPGTAPVVTTRWEGPVRASTAGVVTIGAAAQVAAVATIRGSSQAVLAHVLVVKRRTTRLTLSITRVGRTKTSAWAYMVSKGAVVSCTTSRAVNGHLTLTLPTLKRGQRLKLVTVRG